jgi:HAD superfamily hydrolase (TIGR01509 family)
VGAPSRNIFAVNGADLAGPAAAFDTGRIDDLTFAREVSRLFPEYTPELVLKVLDVWLAGVYPGAEQLVDDIHAAGVRTACLSNTNPRHWSLMTTHRDYAVVNKLHHRFASHLLGCVKPAGEAYERVERAVALPPTSIVFFDDRPENVQAAQSRGWRAFLIDQFSDTARQMEWFLCNVGVL